MPKPQVSVVKRQREQAKREKQQMKAERRQQRKDDKGVNGDADIDYSQLVRETKE
jgi:hypothetical protein